MRHSKRKLFLFGRYSIALLLPKKWLEEFGVGADGNVLLEFDVARKRIIVRPATDINPTDDKKELTTRKTERPKSTDTDAQGWEDIPQL